MDGSGGGPSASLGPRRTSFEGASRIAAASTVGTAETQQQQQQHPATISVVAEEPDGVDADDGDKDASAPTAEAASAANDILADLDALRREVDALRGQYEADGSGVAGGIIEK